MQVQLPPFIKSISGKLNKNDTLVYRTRNGITHAYHLHNHYRGPLSKKRKRQINFFKDAVRITSAILSNNTLKQHWEQLYKNSKNQNTKQYSTLRGFIIGIHTRFILPSLLSETTKPLNNETFKHNANTKIFLFQKKVLSLYVFCKIIHLDLKFSNAYNPAISEKRKSGTRR